MRRHAASLSFFVDGGESSKYRRRVAHVVHTAGGQALLEALVGQRRPDGRRSSSRTSWPPTTRAYYLNPVSANLIGSSNLFNANRSPAAEPHDKRHDVGGV